MKQQQPLWIFFLALASCGTTIEKTPFSELAGGAPSIQGTDAYLDSPYLTAGDRVYMVGHQNGSFPELGWHIPGEMGGVWNHPIKLMDGFDAYLHLNDSSLHLNNAQTFVNYPFANRHGFVSEAFGLDIDRWQFVPDHKEGIAIQYQLTNRGNSSVSLDFEFVGHTDLRPTWLGEETGMIDGEDRAEFFKDQGVWLVKDGRNEWFAVFGADEMPATSASLENPYEGLGVSNSLRYPVTLEPGQSKLLNMTIAGSFESREAALQNYLDIRENAGGSLRAKKERYAALEAQSKLTIPDKQLQQTFEWLKYNCDWLVRSVPGIGTGIGAGIPDYPWWFGVDSEYALKGYMAVGQSSAVYHTIALLDSVSSAVNGNGRILHEMSTNGLVFNKGNINETPQFASLIWEIYRWNGDMEFLKRYFPTVKKGLNWLMAENDSNNNLFPDGFGMMEIHGLDSEMIDVAAYTQRAFADAANMAEELGEAGLAREYEETAALLKSKINTEFWAPAFNSYADFLGTDAQALRLIEDAIVRADTLNKPWAVTELQQTAETIKQNPSTELRPFVVHHNWVVNTPMEMKIADPDKALKALKTAEKFTNPFGVFVTGIDRDASAGSDDGSFKGSTVFSYTGAVMTLPTGVLAISENNYGRPDKALEYLQRMSRTFSYALPGSMYEVSPDYGMMTQAWNIYSYAIPIVQQFFGIQPGAARKEVLIQPQMPSSWDEASLENVTIAGNQISVYYRMQGSSRLLRVEQSNPDWTIHLALPAGVGADYTLVQGTAETNNIEDTSVLSGSGKVLEVSWNE